MTTEAIPSLSPLPAPTGDSDPGPEARSFLLSSVLMADQDADLLARAVALQPLVREAAPEGDRDRHLPERVARAMAEAGLYRLAVPSAFGGYGADPATQIAAIEAISRADGSAGWNLMIGIETSALVALAPESVADLYADPTAILCSSTATLGQATVEEGGVRVRGRWPFASGCHNATWFCGLCQIGEPPDATIGWAVLPMNEVRILDTWNTRGMRGSGSHDIEVTDALVPAVRVIRLLPGLRAPADPRLGPSARIPTGSRLAYNKTGVALGIARAAIDAFVELAATKTPRLTSVPLRERSFAHVALGTAEAELGSARAFVFERVSELWASAVAGQPVTDEDRARLQIACSHAVAASIRAVGEVHRAAGTDANRAGTTLERCQRDVIVVGQHLTVAHPLIEDAARMLLGLEPTSLVLGAMGR